MDYDRHDALLHWLFRQTQGDAWFRPNEENISSGVALRISDVNDPTPQFRVFPYETPTLEPFEAAVVALNPAVAVKIRSAAVHAALAGVLPHESSIYVDANTRIQVLDTMLALPAADKEQCAAFIRDERVLVIWSDSLDRIIPTCTDFDERLIKLLWRAQPLSTSGHSSSLAPTLSRSTPNLSARSSVEGTSVDHAMLSRPTPKPSQGKPPHSLALSATDPVVSEAGQAKAPAGTPATGALPGTDTDRQSKRNWYRRRKVDVDLEKEGPALAYGNDNEVVVEYDKENLGDSDGEEGPDFDPRRDERKTALLAPVYNGLAAGLALLFIGNGLSVLLQEWTLDGMPVRFALLAVAPLLYCVSLFFALQIIQNLSMILGPIEQYHANSKYYSAIKPRPLAQGGEHALPHVTIQMPVYKEGLSGVLAPSITSLKRAMQTYARQGGTSSLFVNDDGLRLLPPAARKERLEFYALHSIGWVARPPHGSLGEDEAPNGFVGSEVLDGSEDAGSGGGDEEKGHKTQPTPFVRAGRFKKASNMNYALALSMKLEHHLARLIAEQKEAEKEDVEELEQAQAQGQEEGGGTSTPPPPPVPTRTRSAPNLALLGAPAPSTPHSNLNANSSGTSTPPSRDLAPSPSPSAVGPGKTPEDPSSSSSPSPSPSSSPSPSPNTKTPIPVCLEDQALALAVEETWAESVGGAHRPWAGNGRAARMGEIVLIVDSDTVVPEDCLRDAAREMGACPSVAIIQHESDVMQVAHHYFENGIAYFTRRINKCISMACANGEVAPFVGHNAFLRWRALQDAAFVDPADGKEKIWSESNVSEDFDMALRLMGCGYIIRWATYSEGGFKEGVSLSVDDELNRWQKYSYGCSELLFNPIIEWFRRGPFAQQIHRFMWSNAPLHYKVSMMAYMFSYYGIAASVTISVINYILLGFQFGVDGFYMHSFEIWLATTVVFFGSGTVGYSLLQYRLGQKQLIPAFLENLMWIPFFFFFFGGLSIPVSQAILAHMFSYNISWSATIKEVQRSNFFKEIPKIAKRFWFPMSFSLVLIAGMIICATSLVPLQYRVDGASAWAVIFPVSLISACHILFPIVLNPWLMVFSY